jgi:hypothetical protein
MPDATRLNSRNAEHRHRCCQPLWAAVVFAGGVLFLAPAAFAEQPKEVVVTNESLTIQGEVTAVLDEPVEVTGSVDVNSVPSSVLDRLDLALDRLDDLVNASQTPVAPADYVRTFFTVSRDNTEQNFGARVLVSWLSVNAQNDDGIIFFCDSPVEQCGDNGVPYIVLGANNEFPTVVSVPFPQPVALQSYFWICSNAVENCEVTVSIVGTRMD